MGDILMMTPSLRALAARFPEASIDVIVGGGMTAALTGHPDVRRVLTFDKRGKDARPAPFLAFLALLWQERYDLVVNLHPSVKSWMMVAAARPKRVVTFRKRILKNGVATHAIEDFAKELRPLGIEAVSDRSLDFIVPDDALKSVDRMLEDLGVRPGERIVVINPAASRPINRWPQERFRAVARHFAGMPGTRVVLTGGSSQHRSIIDGLDEMALAATIAEGDRRIIDLAGKLTLKQLGALLMRASVLLTCDTGPMHVAAALETSMVVLSGAADPDRTGPLTKTATVLIDRALGCVPCRDRVCARGDVKCMDNLRVDQTILALERSLQNVENPSYVRELRVVS
jgi:lipopolysaccharide heptosyltransferase II